MSVEIYICDLKPEVQEQVLSELNLSSDILFAINKFKLPP